MIYKALTCTLNPLTDEFSEILIAHLNQEGFEGIYEENNTLIAYIPDNIFNESVIHLIIGSMKDIGCNIDWVIEEIQEKNWNEVWESNFEPVIIDNRCVIRAPFHGEFKDFQYQITIEPKMSFGTGHHQTTHMMLDKILDLDLFDKKILDMGCGTGVLSILASLKGASHIIAIDIDHWAVENTIENVLRNHTDNITVVLGGKEKIPAEKFDLILANINRNILLDQINEYARVCIDSGLLILSGILLDDIDIITEKALENGFSLADKKSLNNWALLMFKRN